MNEWFFDGIGTELISLIIGGIFGGFTGFGICKHKTKIRQEQHAGNCSELHQNSSAFKMKNKNGEKNELVQSQEAGDNSKLYQE
ncbi:MAG: hypothetical protein LBM93_09730 [Oscillospiraceae bacterium]|jgi:hypothetical protein|nr:hypothetical protein [Oscillospiraceae bacterium]